MTHPLDPEAAREVLLKALATTKARRYLGDAVYASWDGYQPLAERFHDDFAEIMASYGADRLKVNDC